MKKIFVRLVNWLIVTFKIEASEISDSYHSFNELYDIRTALCANLFNEWHKKGIYNVHKAKLYNDMTLPFGRNDYFIVCAEIPFGQISFHYPMTLWHTFQIAETEKALATFDNHTTKDVITRLIKNAIFN